MKTIVVSLDLLFIWPQQFDHKAIHQLQLLCVSSYWWVLDPSAFTDRYKKKCHAKMRQDEGREKWQRHRAFLAKLSQNAEFHRMSCKWGNGRGCITRSKKACASGLIQPLRSFRGLACVYVHSLLAVLTLHGTAPFELALALGDLLDSSGVVATPTAHDLAAVSATWCLIADPSSCAQGPCTEFKTVTF